MIIVLGMAGSGKTTLLSRIYRHLSVEKNQTRKPLELIQVSSEDGTAPVAAPAVPAADGDATNSSSSTEQKTSGGYYMNLDPAVTAMPFPPQVDIRDTVDYKGVMSQYKLGPNGAIMTSLNLFATKFDQVLKILENRALDNQVNPDKHEQKLDYIVVDTPGQIEAFTWSSSGQIFTESLASSFPTILCFVVDTPRSTNPNTFMSNMLYGCSMLYRSRLPLLVAFNKTDIVDSEFAENWMTDYESFQTAIDDMGGDTNGSGYYATLTRSMALTLDEFYSVLRRCGVSAATGDGMDTFFERVEECRNDFFEGYLKDLELRRNEQTVKKEAVGRESLKKLEEDMAQTKM